MPTDACPFCLRDDCDTKPAVVDSGCLDTIARLRTELATLREDLAHLTSDAGPDSCADQVTRRLAAEAELARATDLARTSASCAAERARRVTELEAELARVTKERDLFERDAETAYDKAWADLRAQLAESNRERDALHWAAKVFSGLLMDAADIPVPDMYDATAVREALHTLLRQRDEAREERDHLAALVGGDATVARINYEGAGPLEIALRHPLVVAMVMAAFDTLDSAGAENFVTCDYTHPDTGHVLSAIYQMKGGKTPAEALSEARAELAGSIRELDEAMWAHAECLCHIGGDTESNLREFYPRHADRLIAERARNDD